VIQTSEKSVKQISEVNTVAFLPTAGIFQDSEGLYLLENKWSGREDLNLRPLVPNQIPKSIGIDRNLWVVSDCY
jgi:hypothetical protein